MAVRVSSYGMPRLANDITLAISGVGLLVFGDPRTYFPPLTYAIDNAKALVDSNVPVFGICLGHQILGLALGGRTVKLPFGHHGANHPVQDRDTGPDRGVVAAGRDDLLDSERAKTRHGAPPGAAVDPREGGRESVQISVQIGSESGSGLLRGGGPAGVQGFCTGGLWTQPAQGSGGAVAFFGDTTDGQRTDFNA